jgi:long-chain acyl-CoA synthetase
VKVGSNSELLIRGPSVMSGYWRNPAATADAIDREGWFHSGDQGRVAAGGQITITGRLKEVIVLANGEKVAPADLELAIVADRLFEQVLVVGEGRPYLAALAVLNNAEWDRLTGQLQIAGGNMASPKVEQLLLERISARMAHFPGYARIRRIQASLTPWGVEDGLLTATLKLRRQQVVARYAAEIEMLYAGH